MILINKETDEYRYYAPGSNNSFFIKPKRVDRTSDWGDIDISQETLLQYALNNRENTKWIPLMLTNIVVSVYHLGVSTLEAIPQIENTFGVSIDIYTLCEDGAVILRYLSENKFEDKITLNLYESHLSYVSNIPGYLQKYKCSACHRHFDQLSNWKKHRGSCAMATQF